MDKNVLYYYIRRSGHSITTLCAVIGMSKSTFYRKVNGNGDFTLSEMMTIAEAVGVENPTEIFFSKEVSKMTLFTPLGGGIMKRNTVELIIGAGSFMLVLQFLCLVYLANSCNGFWIALAFVALCFCLIWCFDDWGLPSRKKGAIHGKKYINPGSNLVFYERNGPFLRL